MAALSRESWRTLPTRRVGNQPFELIGCVRHQCESPPCSNGKGERADVNHEEPPPRSRPRASRDECRNRSVEEGQERGGHDGKLPKVDGDPSPGWGWSTPPTDQVARENDDNHGHDQDMDEPPGSRLQNDIGHCASKGLQGGQCGEVELYSSQRLTTLAESRSLS